MPKPPAENFPRSLPTPPSTTPHLMPRLDGSEPADGIGEEPVRQSRRPTTLARPLTPAAWRLPLGAQAAWVPGRPKAAALPATSATAPRCSRTASASAASPPPTLPGVRVSCAGAAHAASTCSPCIVDLPPTAEAIICAICICICAMLSRAALASPSRSAASTASRRAAFSASSRPFSDFSSFRDSCNVCSRASATAPPRRTTSAPTRTSSPWLCTAARAATSAAAAARVRSASALVRSASAVSSRSCIWSESAAIFSRNAAPPPPPTSRTSLLCKPV